MPSPLTAEQWNTSFPGAIARLNAHLGEKYEAVVARADVRVNGSRPWDIQVHDDRLPARVALDRSVGLGDAYIDGWWDCEQLDQLMVRLLGLRAKLTIGVGAGGHLLDWFAGLRNLQSRSRAAIVARRHYDLPSDFYMSFLDPYNQYTCGYFQDTEDLAAAQRAKLDMICRKLQLAPGDRVLDIGCGWGGFARFAAENYGARVTGITISDEQLAYAREFTRGLSVELRRQDYRDLSTQETFDKVLVCGMIEHVGHKNYRSLMEVVHRCLAKGGLFLLHTIGSNQSVRSIDPWLHKHIFPNAMLPSMRQMADASEGLFVMEDWHNFRPHYVSTLLAWHHNFEENWHRFADRFDQRLYRTWKYYFLFCAAIFSVGNAQLWQLVFSRLGEPRRYVSLRP